MSSVNEEVLSFNIVIDAQLSEGTKKSIEELKDAKDSAGSESNAVESPTDVVDQDLIDTLKGIDDTELKQFLSLVKNPQDFLVKSLEPMLKRILGSRVVAILGPVGVALIAAAVAVEVIKLLSVKGGPLNRDWRRFIAEEVEVGLSRVQQKENELGISQTILTQVSGFKQNNENFTYNSLYEINDSRLARIGLSDREAGVTMIIG